MKGQVARVALGSHSPRPREEWLNLACTMHAALAGQDALFSIPQREPIKVE